MGYFHTKKARLICNSLRKTYLKPGETKIKASASSDGLTINNSTTVTVRCKMIIDHQMPSELIGKFANPIYILIVTSGYLNFDDLGKPNLTILYIIIIRC